MEGTRPVCRVCSKPMKLLDKAQQKWYCYKDDQIWLGKEQRWHEREVVTKQTVKFCKKCGQKLVMADMFCDKCGAAQETASTSELTQGQPQQSLHTFSGFLIIVGIVLLAFVYQWARTGYDNFNGQLGGICNRLGVVPGRCITPTFSAYLGAHSEIIFVTIGAVALIILGVVLYMRD